MRCGNPNPAHAVVRCLSSSPKRGFRCAAPPAFPRTRSVRRAPADAGAGECLSRPAPAAGSAGGGEFAVGLARLVAREPSRLGRVAQKAGPEPGKSDCDVTEVDSSDVGSQRLSDGWDLKQPSAPRQGGGAVHADPTPPRRARSLTHNERPVALPRFQRPEKYSDLLKIRANLAQMTLDDVRRQLAHDPENCTLRTRAEKFERRVELLENRASYHAQKDRHTANLIASGRYSVITDGLAFQAANNRRNNIRFRIANAEKQGVVLDRKALEEEYRRRDEESAARLRERKLAKSSASEGHKVQHLPGRLKLPLLPPVTMAALIHVDEMFKAPCDRVFSMYRGKGLQDMPSVAFIGVRNVGKTTLVNSLVGRQKLNKLYGQDRQNIEFLALDRLLYLVDIPGYGQRDHTEWGDVALEYIKENKSLREVFFLVGSEAGLTGPDRKTMQLLISNNVDFRIVLTKTDVCKPGDLELTRQQVHAMLLLRRTPGATKSSLLALQPADIAALVPTPFEVSSASGCGLARLRYEILQRCGKTDFSLCERDLQKIAEADGDPVRLVAGQ